MKNIYSILIQLFILFPMVAQEVPPSSDQRIYSIIDSSSPERIEKDIRKLANFGTRNTMSDTVSNTRGIGAARRWIKSEFQNISNDCKGCLSVQEQRTLVKGDDKTQYYTAIFYCSVV